MLKPQYFLGDEPCERFMTTFPDMSVIEPPQQILGLGKHRLRFTNQIGLCVPALQADLLAHF